MVDEICLSCNGLGYIKCVDYSSVIKDPCRHCEGTGQVTWIDNILGKQGDPSLYKHTKWIEEHYFRDK